MVEQQAEGLAAGAVQRGGGRLAQAPEQRGAVADLVGVRAREEWGDQRVNAGHPA